MQRHQPCRSDVRAQAAMKGAQTGMVRPVQGSRPRYAPRPEQKGTLRLFLDSADVRLWDKYQHGTLYGFTTNPTILERDNVPCTLDSFKYLIQQARNLRAQELHIQTWGGTAAAMEATALKILDIDSELITIKLPCTPEGLSAASALTAREPSTKITITGVYTPHQVLMAQSVGADYVAPYLGRMADKEEDRYMSMPGGIQQLAEGVDTMQLAMQAVYQMQCVVYNSWSSMRILVASIRAADQIATLASYGCDTFTFSPTVAEQLVAVPETLAAAAEFEAAAARNATQPMKQ